MSINRLEKEYTVHVYETGPDGKASLWSLFNFMQDIASEHAIQLGFGRDDLMKKNRFWVLSRMFAELYEIPSWFDKITVKTWPFGTENLFAMRNYEIRFHDGRKIAAGSSSWLIIDRTTKKIQRPDELLTQYNDENRSAGSPVRSAVKLPGALENAPVSSSFRVRISDIDVNLHTNNANYIRWITDSYDLSFILSHTPVMAEINYLAESLNDDEIVIRTSGEENGENTFNHSVIRTSDRRELCRARFVWSPNMGKNEKLR